jgi:hypothetical protein
MTKICKVCRLTKPLSEFPHFNRSKDGFHSRCKRCNVELVTRWRKENPEKTAALMKRVMANRRSRNLKQDEAHRQVDAALYAGKLVKPDTCQRCHQQFPLARIHAHHHDYDKPLEVEWLCHPCHIEQHKRDGAYGRGRRRYRKLRCETCKRWEDHLCTRLGRYCYDDDKPMPPRDGLIGLNHQGDHVETGPDFGCIHHEPKTNNVSQ